MIGHHVRNKGGVSTAMLIGEMAAWYAGQNCSLYDALQALYTRYGWYGERTEQFYRTGQAGAKEIADFTYDPLAGSAAEADPGELRWLLSGTISPMTNRARTFCVLPPASLQRIAAGATRRC